MKQSKGFILLGNMIIFLLSASLMLAALRSYHICLLTLQKKSLLEQAINIAKTSGMNNCYSTNLVITSKEQAISPTLTITEVQICHNEEIIFSLAEAK